MGLGQPDVEGHEARLHAETDERQQEKQPRTGADNSHTSLEVAEVQRTRPASEQREQRHEESSAEVARHQIGPACLPGPLLIVLQRHEEEGRHSHELPAHEEQDGVAGEQDNRDAGDQEVEKKPRASRASPRVRPGQVLVPVEGT